MVLLADNQYHSQKHRLQYRDYPTVGRKTNGCNQQSSEPLNASWCPSATGIDIAHALPSR